MLSAPIKVTAEMLLDALTSGRLPVPSKTPPDGHTQVSWVGSGESYSAWLVTIGDERFLFRFPRRTPREMPAPMAQEFAALRLVPPDIGSHGIAVEDSVENSLNSRYLVTSYVPGETAAGPDWTEQMLLSQTAQLARLHGRDVEGVEGLKDTSGTSTDLSADLVAGYEGWERSAPDLARQSSAPGLLPLMNAYLQRRRWAFAEPGKNPLIHGDMVATNVVFDAGSTARFIDWEWAHMGDVAQDLAYIGGEVYGGPWYVPLRQADTEDILRLYWQSSDMPARRGETFERLLRRREAWEVWERFMSSLHFERVASAPGNEQYIEWVRNLRETLQRRLRNDPLD